MPRNDTVILTEVKVTTTDNEKHCASEAVHTGQKEP